MVFGVIVYDLKGDGLFNSGMPRHTKGTEEILYLFTWGVGNPL